MEHLVYCDAKAKVLNKILNGTKTMIIRGAAGRKLPHGRVFEGESLYFIENNGDGLIKAKAVVKSVFNSEKMTEDESKEVVAKNQDKLNLTEAQIKRWAGKKVLCLIEIKDAEAIEPLKFSRQNNMDDWITVESISTVLEGSSEEYHSIRAKK
ncbi:hypothetical protein [Desnuesiella massiliensis]|uniref:hypothetical protein n=1 Tax=Desnuesiella massiliensis TaxID=1650662 RepID=UPI0006E283A7|nr:hypothetical protein [Desnuesiella massiliensis]